MNWGHKLFLVFVVFAAGIFYLVYRSMHIETELVSKEYYKDELRYQQVIDGTNQANELSAPVQLSQQADKIMVKMPGEMRESNVSGNIWFYCPADSKKDKHLLIQLDADAVQHIDRNILLPGIYTVKIDWRTNNKNYHSEQPFTIL